MGSWCKKGEYYAQISPKSELCGSSGQTLTTNVSMTLCTWQICHQTHVLCGRTTFVPNQIRYQINTAPPPAVAWTRAWLLQGGGGGGSTCQQMCVSNKPSLHLIPDGFGSNCRRLHSVRAAALGKVRGGSMVGTDRLNVRAKCGGYVG